MKRLLLLLCFGLLGFAATAQMMPDSTVQFVARWNPGDKQVYNITSTEYKVTGKDTTDVRKLTEIMQIEVLSKTDSGYTLCVTYHDTQSSNPQMTMLYKLMEEASGDMKILLTTDIYGSLQTVENLQEIIDYHMVAVDPFMEMLAKEMGEELDPEMRASFKEYLVNTLCDANILTQSINDRIGRMLYFHGNRMKFDEKYNSRYKTASIFPGMDESMTAHAQIWVDKKYTDSYSAVGRIHSVISKENLTHAVEEYVRTVLAVSGMTPDEAQETIDNSRETIDQMQLNSEEFINVEVHMKTGWPLNLYYSKYIYKTVEGVTITEEKRTSVKIILQK